MVEEISLEQIRNHIGEIYPESRRIITHIKKDKPRQKTILDFHLLYYTESMTRVLKIKDFNVVNYVMYSRARYIFESMLNDIQELVKENKTEYFSINDERISITELKYAEHYFPMSEKELVDLVARDITKGKDLGYWLRETAKAGKISF